MDLQKICDTLILGGHVILGFIQSDIDYVLSVTYGPETMTGPMVRAYMNGIVSLSFERFVQNGHILFKRFPHNEYKQVTHDDLVSTIKCSTYFARGFA